jgi:hypothetical protein
MEGFDIENQIADSVCSEITVYHVRFFTREPPGKEDRTEND